MLSGRKAFHSVNPGTLGGNYYFFKYSVNKKVVIVGSVFQLNAYFRALESGGDGNARPVEPQFFGVEKSKRP